MRDVERRCLVTGATGFIGRHLVEALVRRGDRVVCLVRRTSRLDRLAALPVELVYGDITDPASLHAAVDSVEEVYHLAGLTTALRSQDFHRVNVTGTAALLEACRRTGGPRRTVLVSSLAACGPSAPGQPLGEDDLPRPLSPYGRSKLAAEAVARAYSRYLPMTVVRPPVVYGPGDRQTLPFFRLVHRGVRPLFRRDTQVSLIHVADLVAGLLLAAGRDAAIGQTYFLAGDETPTLEELTGLIALALGRRAVALRLPYHLVRAAARALEVSGRLTHRPPAFDRDKVRELYQPAWCCRSDRARRDLGFVPRFSVAEGLRQTALWYRRQGWL
ncbi:MAG: NAD-dependent epimerase/dehydratase family protein [Chloroflexi bacterium]|nr:NAD-dependent epimerase/dehydratase family protein [Chloroflexota bacterium]